MRSIRLLHAGLIIFIIVTLFFEQGLMAPLHQDPVWTISSPGEGSTVSGEVIIQGTATHPSFASYGVLYAAGPRPTADSQWVPIVFGVTTMVVNGALATWDTSSLPNGQYSLALAVYETGDTEPHLHFTNNINVLNEEATPTPEPTPEPLPGEPGAEPTDALQPGEGAAPVAPTVEQPPTATPRPTPTLAAEATPTEEEDEGFDPADIFSGVAIKEAFTTGAWLAVLLYLVGGLYVLAKAAVRYYIRQQRRRQRS